MRKEFLVALVYFTLVSCADSGKDNSAARSDDGGHHLFTLLTPDVTKINFANVVVDSEEMNILSYRNFYNGGGVAIGDINNDSLPDLYFTANQRENKLYLNRGNFVFEDITTRAGVGGTKKWSTGVTMADVNSDGLLDIYVCNAGDYDGSLRENELFINNGDLTFSEKAAEYNLNNEGYSTHAAFFDYDTDGDLDCYILNNSFKDPAKIELYKKMRETPDKGGDKLMRNDGSHFTDVTTSSGIFSSDIGFGLGVSIGDVNNDLLPDIYVSNDFWERDYLYINQTGGKYSEELIKRINYCPVSSMGADIADINNDGWPEIVTTDMLPGDNNRLKTTITFDPYHLEDLKYRANFHYQMIQNCLQLNMGNGYFQETAHMAGVAATDWSWAALIFDFNNDGRKDIYISNGIGKDIMSMDFRDFLANNEKQLELTSGNKNSKALDFIGKIPSQKLMNNAFVNAGPVRFEEHAAALGLGQLSFSNGSAYGDLDNDGDLDLVVNNLNEPPFVYRNESELRSSHNYLKVFFKGTKKNPFGIGARVEIRTNDGIQILENYNTRGFQSSVEPVIIFGIGNDTLVHELKVSWPDGKEQVLRSLSPNSSITLDISNAREMGPTNKTKDQPIFEEVTESVIPAGALHKENAQNDFDFEILLTRMISTEGPRVLVGDVNSDNLDDMVLLGAEGDPDKLYVQQASGKFVRKNADAFERDRGFESTCGVFIDYDKDKDLDLMVGSGGYRPNEAMRFVIRCYRNDGLGNFSPDPTRMPKVVGNFSTMCANDFDNDGLMDVFCGARTVPGNYGLPPQSYLLKNDGGSWVDVAVPDLGNIGMVTDASWADVDNDDDADLVVVGDWMPIQVFENNYGRLEKSITIPKSSGWWNRVEAADVDQDGDVDFVMGNWGSNIKFKASPERPLRLYVSDFDQNGKSEFIVNWYAPLDTVPSIFALKNELTFQMPSLRKKILRYADYANHTYESLFPLDVREGAIEYVAEHLQTSILWNEGKGFRLEALPLEAQISPVFGIAVHDFNSDGHSDIWLGGNFYALKPQVGRQDASKGVLLERNGAQQFQYRGPWSAGIVVNGEVRDAVVMNNDKGVHLFVARNNDNMLVFKKR
jgi:enediyne biosynthesis protein E4